MATYTDIYKNLGVKLVVNQTSQNIANNTSVVSWYLYAYKISSHNPWNNLGQTPFKATINGSVVYNSNASYDLRGSTTQQLISSGTSTITHTADGTKSIAVEGYANYTSTGYGYGAVTAKGSLSLTSIPRVSIATLSTASFNFGQSVTLTTNRSSSSFTHSVFYVIGTTEYSLATGVGASTTITIPNSVMSSYPSASSASMIIRTKTLNGTTQIGTSDISVTVNVPSTIIPTIGSLAPSDTVAAANIFTANDEQYIRGLSKLKATAGTVAGNNGSTIKSYHYRIVDANGAVVTGTETSSTSSSHTYGTFSFPTKAQGSAVYKVQCRVLDSRNRYSAWRDSKVFRVHYYEAPTINLTGVTRSGTGNTSIIGNRTYNVYSLKEGGTTERNTGTFVVKYREKGVTAWTTATGGATGLTLNNSSATFVTGAATSKFYEIQATVTDKIGSAFSSIISVGSEFVTMEILRGKAVGIGIAPTTGGRNLYVGTGGIYSYGAINSEGIITSVSSGHTLSLGSRNASYAHYETSSPSHYFNKKLQVAGDVFAGTSYNRKLAYQDEVHASFGNSTLTTVAQMDNMVTPGVYQYSGTVFNHLGAYGLIIARVGGGVATHNGTNTWLYQTAYATNGHIYQRNRINAGAWSGWARMPRMSDIPTVPTITSGTNANGNWYNINGILLICWYRFSITGRLTASQMNGSWTYPMPYAFAPAVSIGSRADSDPNSTAGYRRAGSTAFHQYNESATKTDILYAVNNGDVPATGQQKFLNIFAMGTPA